MSENLSVADTAMGASAQPLSGLDQAKGFIGDLARPFALIVLSGCCGAGLLLTAVTADKLGLALTAIAAMYGAKAWEARGAAKSGADIEVAKANAAAGATS